MKLIDSVNNWVCANLMPLIHRWEQTPVSLRLNVMISAASLGTCAIFVAANPIVGMGFFFVLYGFAIITGGTVEASCDTVHDYVSRYGIEGCDHQAEKGEIPCGKMPVVIKRCEQHQICLPDEISERLRKHK